MRRNASTFPSDWMPSCRAATYAFQRRFDNVASSASVGSALTRSCLTRSTYPRASISARPASCSLVNSSMRMHSLQFAIHLDQPVESRDEEPHALRQLHQRCDIGHDAGIVEAEEGCASVR